MTGWRHTSTLGPVDCHECWNDSFEPGAPQDRICRTPTPDPASPCGHAGCLTEPGYGPGVRLTPHFVHDLCSGDGGDHGPSCHPYQPTRCACGHSIEPVR